MTVPAWMAASRRQRRSLVLLVGYVITEMSVTEQRYQPVLEVEARKPVVEVAHRFGVLRQAIPHGEARYRSDGLEVPAASRCPAFAPPTPAPKWPTSPHHCAVPCDVVMALRADTRDGSGVNTDAWVLARVGRRHFISSPAAERAQFALDVGPSGRGRVALEPLPVGVRGVGVAAGRCAGAAHRASCGWCVTASRITRPAAGPSAIATAIARLASCTGLDAWRRSSLYSAAISRQSVGGGGGAAVAGGDGGPHLVRAGPARAQGGGEQTFAPSTRTRS